MPGEVLPQVRLLFACDGALQDPPDKKWILKHPWSVVQLPPDAEFPFTAAEVWLYAQLTDGVGIFDLRAEMWQLQDDGTRRAIGRSTPARNMTFRGGSQLLVKDIVFHIRQVLFPEAGFYEFRITADGHGELPGMTFELRILDGSDTP